MKRKMKRKILAFLLFSAVGGTVLAGCSSGAEDSTSVRLEAESSSAGSSVSSNGLEVHIGDQPSFFILKIADKEGYFEDEFKNSGVKIVVDDFVNQGSAVVEAMNSGDVDLGIIGSMPLVTADANGSGFKAISSVNVSEDGFKLLTAPGLQVDGVSGLKGKKIAVKFSSNEHEMLLTLLKNAGLSETDVEILNMSADDCLNSLLAGKMKIVYDQLGMSMRSYHKSLKMARTIADLNGREMILERDLMTAVGFRLPEINDEEHLSGKEFDRDKKILTGSGEHRNLFEA